MMKLTAIVVVFGSSTAKVSLHRADRSGGGGWSRDVRRVLLHGCLRQCRVVEVF